VDPALPRLPRQLEKPEQKPKFSWYLLIAAVAIGAGARIFGPSWMRVLFEGVSVENFAGAGALAIAFAIAIVWHEAGHLTAALLLNFDILGLSLGPIRATYLHGSWSFHLSGNFFSASVSAIPRDNHAWRKRMLLVVAAGPAATFLSGTISGLLLFSGVFDSWMKNLLTFSTELNIFFFALGLVPNGSRARARNDATLCYSLMRNTVEAQEILLYHLVTQLSITGVRPRDYPERIIRRLAATRGRPDMSLIFAQAIAFWALDCEDLQTARAWQRRALELSEFCDLRMQNLALAQSAFFDVLFESDFAAAKFKFAQVDLDALSPRNFMHRAKAAAQLTEANISETLAEIQRARFSFPRHLPYYEFERKLLQQLHERALEVAEQHRNAQLRERVRP